MRLFKIIMVLLLAAAHLPAAELSTEAEVDWTRLSSSGLGLGLSALVELQLKEHLVPESARWTEPGKLDRKIRQLLRWSPHRLEQADHFSDYTMLGAVAFGLGIVPLASEADWEPVLSAQLQGLALTSLTTNLIKILSARQRPYAYFRTLPTDHARDRTSFCSGHTSLTTAAMVMSATLLTETGTRARLGGLLGAGFYGLGTGALRIAGDQHYFTDVVCGAILGGTIGYLVANRIEISQNENTYSLDRTLPLVTVRFPIEILTGMTDL